jgi:hypothetical protein
MGHNKINDGKCYWYNTGSHEDKNAKLWKLIPPMGSVSSPRGKNKLLEKYRRASKLYYDLYSNGLYNRSREWHGMFGFSCIDARLAGSWGGEGVEKAIEGKMDKIISDAWNEQLKNSLGFISLN